MCENIRRNKIDNINNLYSLNINNDNCYYQSVFFFVNDQKLFIVLYLDAFFEVSVEVFKRFL